MLITNKLLYKYYTKEVININIQSKINKLVIALLQMDKIIKIQVQENYSFKFKRTFRTYKIVETTETEIKLKQEYYSLKKEYKNKIKSPNVEEKLRTLKADLQYMKVPVIEFRNKVEILIYLAERYKELIS